MYGISYIIAVYIVTTRANLRIAVEIKELRGQSVIVKLEQAIGQYVLYRLLLNRGLRVRGNLIYVTLCDDKVYIEYDGIERGIGDELIRRGIPQAKIVLAFLSLSREKDLVPA